MCPVRLAENHLSFNSNTAPCAPIKRQSPAPEVPKDLNPLFLDDKLFPPQAKISFPLVLTKNLKSLIYVWKGFIATGLFHLLFFSIRINMCFICHPISTLLGALHLLVH
jgi:hypothetical protein